MDLERITVDVGVMMDVLGVSEQFVGRLVKDGVVIKEGRGAYLLLPSVRRYIAQIKDRQRSVSVEGEEARRETVSRDPTYDFQLRAFVDAVRGAAPALTGGADAIAQMAAMETIAAMSRA